MNAAIRWAIARPDAEGALRFIRAQAVGRLDGADYAEAARCCEAVLAAIAGNAARWWESLRAQVKSRLAIALLGQGRAERCARLLTKALDSVTTWQEHPALATVLDACAVYTLRRDSRDDENRAATADQAARLLGAAHAIRGAFDESSLDAPPAHEAAKATLGPHAFQSAYESALTTTYESALTLP